MGRVSKHKKIKSCDPFYKGPRKNPVRKGDLPPPNDDDQPAPKALLHLFRRVNSTNPINPKKGPTSKSGTKVKSTGPKRPQTISKPSSHMIASGEEPRRGADEGAPDPAPPVTSRAAMFVRKPGESMRDYLERIDIESKARIAGSLRKQKEKSTKRKKYLEERRKKLKSRKLQRIEHMTKDFDEFQDQVRFGEVVQAPPRLSAKPRGSSKKPQKAIRQLELLKKLPPSLAPPTPPANLGLKHKKDLEEERNKVISEYRMAKKARLEGRTTN